MKKITSFFIFAMSLISMRVYAQNNADYSYYSKDTLVTHMSINLNVNFDKKILDGYVTYNLANTHGTTLVLDAAQLDIKKVTDSADKKISFSLSKPDARSHQALSIPVSPTTTAVRVYYRTRPDSNSLSWMNPAQTKGGKHPYVFSMGQPDVTRNWLPCQDTPRVRTTFDAAIKTANKDLRAVVSAPRIDVDKNRNIYYYKSDFKVPAYLIAIAAGHIEYKQLSKRTGIYAEPEYIESASKEFEDMESMIEKVEPLMGAFPWGQYNLLILPPSFHYSGMENPFMVYINPIVMTGDKANVPVIAHELSHFWSGNLVTNATWLDMWLNEGMTTYLETIIVREVFGERAAAFNTVDHMDKLKSAVKDVADGNAPAESLKLKYDLATYPNPDDAINDVPYCKGAFFLDAIEEYVGRDEMYAFLRSYFKKYAFQSVSTEQFLSELGGYFKASHPNILTDDKLDVHGWVYTSKIPAYPSVPEDLYDGVQNELTRFNSGTPFKNLTFKQWTTDDWVYFFNHLPSSLTEDQMNQISDVIHKASVSKNAYAMRWWYTTVVAKQFKKDYPALKEYLINNRIKRFRFLYFKLAETPEGLAYAREIFEASKNGLHPAMYDSVKAKLYPESTTKN